jgi:hypothetical protein
MLNSISHAKFHLNQTINVEKWGQKFIYIPKENVAFMASIFKKITIMQQIVVNIFFAEFYPNRTKNVENTGKISLMPLSKVRLSLHRFSQNSQLLNGIT